jgi:hypothetical protein
MMSDLMADLQKGWTALMVASAWGRLDVARLLLDRGAKVDAAAKVGWCRGHGRRLACRRPQCDSQLTLAGHIAAQLAMQE